MIIHGTGGVQGPQPIPPAKRNPYSEQAQNAPRVARTDSADISEQARLLQKLSETSEIRQDKVDAVRKQIEAGTYETEDKLDVAVDRLLEDLL